jgi:hypothetical protein
MINSLLLRARKPRNEHCIKPGVTHLTNAEVELLASLLAQDVDRGDVLLAQLRGALVVSSCDCGCGSIGFVPADSNEATLLARQHEIDRGRVPPATPLPVEGEVLDDDGSVVGGVLAIVRNGRLLDIEVFSLGDPLPLPDVAHVRWKERWGS